MACSQTTFTDFFKTSWEQKQTNTKNEKKLFLPYSIHSINDDAKELPRRTDVDCLPTRSYKISILMVCA